MMNMSGAGRDVGLMARADLADSVATRLGDTGAASFERAKVVTGDGRAHRTGPIAHLPARARFEPVTRHDTWQSGQPPRDARPQRMDGMQTVPLLDLA